MFQIIYDALRLENGELLSICGVLRSKSFHYTSFISQCSQILPEPEPDPNPTRPEPDSGRARSDHFTSLSGSGWQKNCRVGLG